MDHIGTAFGSLDSADQIVGATTMLMLVFGLAVLMLLPSIQRLP